MDELPGRNIPQYYREALGRIKSEAAAGDHPEPGRIHQGHDGKEKNMQEKKLVDMLEDLMSDICDNNCKKIDSKTEEEAEEICANCPAGDHICRILNENVRYKKIVLCEECEYYTEDDDCQGNKFHYCRNDCGMPGNVGSSDGCSKGRRK